MAISEKCRKDLQKWSVSGAIFDVDGDGFNDYFVVNHRDADSPIHRPCYDDKSGERTTCHPLTFSASPDDVYLGLPIGGFRLPRKSVIEYESPRRALGIVAGNLDSQRMSVYVANDLSANHFYRVVSAHSMPFHNVASPIGLAVFANTQTQASMGNGCR